MRKARISVIMLFLVALFTVTTANATALLNPQSSIQPRYVGVNRAASDLTINSSGCAWYAGAILYHFWHHSGLHSCRTTDHGIPGGISFGRPGL